MLNDLNSSRRLSAISWSWSQLGFSSTTSLGERVSGILFSFCPFFLAERVSGLIFAQWVVQFQTEKSTFYNLQVWRREVLCGQTVGRSQLYFYNKLNY